MERRMATIALAVLAGACGRERVAERDTTLLRDSLVPIADAPVLRDTTNPKPSPETVYVATRTPPPAPRVVPRTPPRTNPPASTTGGTTPAPAAGRSSLASGTTISTVATSTIDSKVNKVGDQVRVRVTQDVTAANGRVVIPAGSVVTLEITAIAGAENRGEKGTLAMSARSIEINGSSYPITGRASDYAYTMKAHSVGASEVGKTAAGAAAGAIVGRVIGGKTGTVVGAVGGAAAGAAVAAKSADREIVVAAGNSVTLVLSDDFRH